MSDWHLEDLNTNDRNLDTASALLKSQGWILNSDNLLQRDGEVFGLTLVTYADRPELTVIATAIQAQLREVGITIEVSVDNSSAIPSKHHDQTLELALVARSFGTISDPLAILVDDAKTHKGSDWGHMNWSSQELNQVLGEMMRSDDASYRELAQKASTILAEEMPVIPVVFYTQQVR